MKITGTKSYIQIEEENGNIARFDGEACLGEFYAYASPVRWVRHRGEATDAGHLMTGRPDMGRRPYQDGA